MSAPRPRRAAGRSLPLLLAVLTAACGGVGIPGVPGPTSPGPPPGGSGSGSVPGFDTRHYPGASAMEAWRDASPYRWVGFYLPAPCYTGTTWQGRRPELERMGWGLAVLFVGEQDWAQGASATPPDSLGEVPTRCTRTNVTAENGTLDGAAAAGAASSEGFASGTVLFLDVERVDSVAPALASYVGGWFEAVLADGRYVPGLYVHGVNAGPLWGRAREAWFRAGRTDRPPLWVAGSGSFDLSRRPGDSGVEGATVWQGAFDVRESWGGVELIIDRNVATTGSPSR